MILKEEKRKNKSQPHWSTEPRFDVFFAESGQNNLHVQRNKKPK